MIQRHPSFEHFDFTESYIDVPEISQTSIRVPVRKFVILGGHPDYPKTTHFKRCVLVFEKVVSSKRNVSKYGAPKEKDNKLIYDIESEYEVSDGPFEQVEEEVFLHHLAGVFGVPEVPHGWLNWDIVASSVRMEDIEVDTTPRKPDMGSIYR
jgi:hypothetical protein